MAIFDKPLFTFEMANNHQGSVEHGRQIIREVGKAAEKYKTHFDFAFKFQYRDLDTFIHPDYLGRMDVKNVKRFQETRLTQEEFLELKREVEAQGMFTMCTPFDEISVKRIAEQGYDVLKIASCSFTDWHLLEEIAKAGRPVIASTAGASLEDIDRVVSFFRHRKIDLSLMHCVAEYPTPDEHQQMNQITLLKGRYPDLRVGFSTHESPDNLNPIRVAVAKGAEIFEKHVGVPTDTISLNGYSANPDQVSAWLEAAYQTYQICGISKERYVPQEKERQDLAALQRGVFASHDLQPGEAVGQDDIFLAFPCQPGQMLASHLSKYVSLVAGTNEIGKNQPLMLSNVKAADRAPRIREVLAKVVQLLKDSNVVVPVGSTCEISHHYGIDKFEKTGVTMIDCINREYCKKILVMLPGQSHPFHYHKKKEETFLVLYGTLDVICDGVERHVGRGESVVVKRGEAHAFRSTEGCVFEEISTTHYVNDSFYREEERFVSPRKTTVYLTDEMMRALNISPRSDENR